MNFYDVKGELGELPYIQTRVRNHRTRVEKIFPYGLWIQRNSPNSLISTENAILLTPPGGY